MTIARHYVMTAAEGQDGALDTALRNLADVVRAISGCEGVEMLRDARNASRFVFIEKWESIDAHKAGAKEVPKEAFGPMMAALGASPEGSYLDYVLTV